MRRSLSSRERSMLARSIALLGLAGAATVQAANTLTGWAVLPADTFAPGPTSGQFSNPANGRTPPYLDQQPVQASRRS